MTMTKDCYTELTEIPKILLHGEQDHAIMICENVISKHKNNSLLYYIFGLVNLYIAYSFMSKNNQKYKDYYKSGYINILKSLNCRDAFYSVMSDITLNYVSYKERNLGIDDIIIFDHKATYFNRGYIISRIFSTLAHLSYKIKNIQESISKANDALKYNLYNNSAYFQLNEIYKNGKYDKERLNNLKKWAKYPEKNISFYNCYPYLCLIDYYISKNDFKTAGYYALLNVKNEIIYQINNEMNENRELCFDKSYAHYLLTVYYWNQYDFIRAKRHLFNTKIIIPRLSGKDITLKNKIKRANSINKFCDLLNMMMGIDAYINRLSNDKKSNIRELYNEIVNIELNIVNIFKKDVFGTYIVDERKDGYRISPVFFINKRIYILILYCSLKIIFDPNYREKEYIYHALKRINKLFISFKNR